MKFLILFITFIVPSFVHAGVAGTGGGSVHKVLYRGNNVASAWVCGRGEAGTDCLWVNFKVRAAARPLPSVQPTKCLIYIGEESYRECPKKYGTIIQEWMAYQTEPY